MAIYQPTMITPDLVSGVENGVVFVAVGGNVEVSWQVNGNSPLLAYRIQFFKNDANSTPGTDTGKVTLNDPFYPVSSDGTQNRFSVSVPYGTGGTYFSIAGLDANKQGKFILTQWWGSSDAQSVTQKSASIFRITAKTTVSASGPTYANSVYSFQASVSLPSYISYGESAVLWHRWQIWRPNTPPSQSTLVQDTGKIWGASEYGWTADVLPPGNYFAEFSCETSNGETISKYTSNFEALGDTISIDLSADATVECDRQNGAVHVDCSNIEVQSISGDTNNFAYGSTGSYPATWHFTSQNRSKAEWALPDVGNVTDWGFIWEGYVSQYSNVLLRVTLKNGEIVTFGLADGVSPYYDDPVLNPNVFLPQPDHFLKGSAAKLVYVFLATGTTGEWDIATEYQWSSNPGIVTFNNSTPVKVEILDGLMTTRLYFAFGSNGYHTISTSFIGNVSPEIPDDWGCPVAFLDETGTTSDLIYHPFGTTFSDGQIAPIVREDLTTGEYAVIDVYADAAGSGNILDYGALNGHSYNYYLAYQISNTQETVMVNLGSAQPCFWSWVLIEANFMKNGAKNVYSVQSVYFFGNNFSSGTDGNGASPAVYSNFTPYPLVMRDVTNRHSGTLASLIGSITSPGEYSDTNELRDAIRALSGTANALLIRNRRGDLWEIAVAGEIVCTVQDNALKQPVTATVPWVEIGPVDNPVVRSGATVL